MRIIKIQTTKRTYRTLFDRKELIRLCKAVFEGEGVTGYEAAVNFVDEPYIIGLNKRFFNADTYTDVISFNLADEGIEGEVYINIDIIGEQAAYYKVSFENELKRIVIHGILHLIGYRDSSEEEKKLMRSKEDYYLNL
ncbi:rRNA maturation RNase YbeY [bacterium]|nr:rRNA maturation RNase YbeY [bacterium]